MNKIKICFDDLRKVLRGSQKRITLVPHKNPDGDAIGSSLGMFLYLKKIGHDVCLISPTDYPEFLKWLPSSEEIILFSKDTKTFVEIRIEHSDYLFIIDFNVLSRMAPLDPLLHTAQAIKVLIDHHIDPMLFDLIFSDPIAPATAVLIFKFIEQMGHLDYIDQQIATCLYTGIVTDTGSFRFPSVTPETHRIAAKLLEKGVDIAYINTRLYGIHSEHRMNFLGKTLQNLKILPTYRTAYMVISASNLSTYQYRRGDTEGFVNYGLDIKDIVFSVIFIEEFEEGPIRISFRSRGDFDVNAFAKDHFQGGGHKNAAGGKSDGNLTETTQLFLDILPSYEHILSKDIISYR
ncbi:MAG: bifunctional oligoribonuclease/PAP phosphatase NrnA [Flavobacteriales bacterium]